MGHWVSTVQGAQVPVLVLQTGVVPAHAAPFVAEHWPQEPLAWQAGAFIGHWGSMVQGTHVPIATLQTGVAPMQRELSVMEHWPQEPLG